MSRADVLITAAWLDARYRHLRPGLLADLKRWMVGRTMGADAAEFAVASYLRGTHDTEDRGARDAASS